MNVPVLLIVFNRPETTRPVFEAIRKARPPRLYIAADGPRTLVKSDLERCSQVKAVVESVDWPCEVFRLYRSENLGCGRAVSSAITWFFDHEEMGVILEDDCLPSDSFFRFCDELLIRYRDFSEVMSISGTNLLGSIEPLVGSYGFSEYGGIWGWASWRRAWNGFDLSMAAWRSPAVRRAMKARYSEEQFRFFKKVFDSVEDLDTWDYQWWFSKLHRHGVDIIPARNMVVNLGFGGQGTHTAGADPRVLALRAEELDFPLEHANDVTTEASFENRFVREFYSLPVQRFWSSLILRVKTRLKVVLRK